MFANDLYLEGILVTYTSPFPTFMPSATGNVFQSRTILRHVYMYLPLLVDILALRATNHTPRQVGSETVINRFESIFEPFIQAQTAALRHSMQTNLAVITGSCAMAMMTGEYTSTDNLNFLVVRGGRTGFQAFLIETLRYRLVQRNVRLNYAFDGTCSSFAVFFKGTKYITVTEAGDEGLFKLVLSAHTTADMLFMTPGGLTSFYPSLTHLGITLANHTLVLPATGQRLGCMKHDRFKLHMSMSSVGHACGEDCPTLWHKVADRGTRSLVAEWDSRFSTKHLIQNSNAIWRLALRCENPDCVHHASGHDDEMLLPSQCMPCDLITIQEQVVSIRRRLPESRHIIGLLYPTRGSKPRLVPIPVRNENEHPSRVLDLEILYWVDQMGPDLHYSATGCFRKTYSVKRDNLGTPHNFAYTFLREHTLAHPPPNELLRHVAKGDQDTPDVTGNVLVVKRVRRHQRLIVDCTTDDVFWTNHIIECTVPYDVFWE